MGYLVDQCGDPISNDNPLPVQPSSKITPTHTAATVGTTSTNPVLAANTSRKYALFVNDSDSVIYLKIGAAAEMNKGIRLNAGGGSFEMNANIGNLMTGAIYAISSATNKNLLILEGV
jgi:hypothetical protein